MADQTVTPAEQRTEAAAMAGAALNHDLAEAEITALVRNAQDAADFLKILSHEGRLMILCYLVDGEKSVAELEKLLAVRQPTVSQMLARLRLEGVVETRRDGKAIYYSLADDRARQLIEIIYDMFCRTDK
jgi:ArsR family transcriptional regulator